MCLIPVDNSNVALGIPKGLRGLLFGWFFCGFGLRGFIWFGFGVFCFEFGVLFA